MKKISKSVDKNAKNRKSSISNKYITYSRILWKSTFQDVKIHKGVNKLVNIIKNNEIPSTPKNPTLGLDKPNWIHGVDLSKKIQINKLTNNVLKEVFKPTKLILEEFKFLFRIR